MSHILHLLFAQRRSVVGLLSCVVMVAVLSVSSTARGDMIAIASDTDASEHGLGTFAGTLEYTFDAGSGIGMLTVDITNTSPAANGGFLTGFLFNFDSVDPGAGASLVAAPSNFVNASPQAAPPYGGPYIGGAALMGHWTGGGNPNFGLGVGESGLFQFEIISSDAAMLSAIDFVQSSQVPGFVARFRGFDDGGSDKVPGEVIPAPAAGLLLLGLFGARTRRRC